MSHDIYQQVPQRGDGAQDAENCRITEIADELERLCRVHEAQSGAGETDVSRFETEQRAAEQMAKARGLWLPNLAAAEDIAPQHHFPRYGLFFLWICRFRRSYRATHPLPAAGRQCPASQTDND